MASRAAGMSSRISGQKSREDLMGMLQKTCALDLGHSRGAVSLILITTVHECLKFISLYLKIVYRRYITQGT